MADYPVFDADKLADAVGGFDETYDAFVPELEPVAPEPAPAPEPGDADYDWQAEYPDEPVFVFTTSDGVTVGIPALAGKRKMKAGELRKLRKNSDMDQMFAILERVMSQNALDVSDEFGDEEYAQMYFDWATWSKTTAGESKR